MSRPAPSEQERIPATQKAPDDAPKGRALIVDDNYINRFVAESMLKHLGWNAVSVDGGQAALDALAKGKFDVVLMDCQMPDLDGFETTRRIREAERPRGRHTPIIAMTAGVLEEERKRCFEVGMDDCLEKPLLVEKLVERLGKLDDGPGTAFPIVL